MEDWTIQKLLAATQTYLTKKGADSPRLLSEMLLAHVLGVDRVYLFSHFDQPVDAPERARYREEILRCAAGEPAAYILGEKEFMSLTFKVTPDTLIPRPDTEVLAETALELIQKHGYRRIVDVGTGSGCIPVAIGHYAETAPDLTALDLSEKALAVAKENAARHGVQIRFAVSDLLSRLPESWQHRVELITANLPYVPLTLYRTLDKTVRDYEPRMALTDEQDGLSLYRKLLKQADVFLTPTGRMLWEIDPRQENQLGFIRAAGFDYSVRADLAGRARLVVIKRRGVPEDEPRPTGTLHLAVDAEKPDPARIARAAAIIRQGGLVAFPTETVYGLAASCSLPDALAEIFRVKGRPQESPLLAAIADRSQLSELAAEIPPAAEKLMAHFWPGPLSIVFPARAELPEALKNAAGGVGVRMPANRVALDLIRMAGPISAPSANLHGRPSPTEGAHVLADLNGKIPAVLDAGKTAGGVESTIVDCTESPVRLLRLGAVSREEIEAVLGEPVVSELQEKAGYELRFQVLASADEEAFARKREILQHFGRPYGILSFTEPEEDPNARFCGCFTPESDAAGWFALLRAAENTGIKALLVHPFEPVRPQFPEGLQERILRTLKPETEETQA